MAFLGAFCWALTAPASTSAAPSATKPRARFTWNSFPSGADDMVGLRPEDDPPLDRLDDEVKPDPERGQKDQDREHPRDVERHVELEDQVAEPALGADELPDDGAEHAEDDGDVEPREHEGQRIRERHQSEGLPAAGVERAHEIELGGV